MVSQEGPSLDLRMQVINNDGQITGETVDHEKRASRRQASHCSTRSLTAFVSQSHGQTYPDRRITLVVPYTPGATTDTFGRMLARHMQERLSVPVVVENRPGAGTAIGAGVVANSKPDGYTILLATTTTLAANRSLYTGLSYKVDKFFNRSLK